MTANMQYRRCLRLPVALIVSVVFCSGGCTGGAGAVDAASAEVRALTGTHTRIVWAHGDRTDPEMDSDQLVLMGLDTEDGKGPRVISGAKRSYVKPRFVSRGSRIVFSSRIIPGPPEIFIINWDGSGLRKLADGFAMAVWQHPTDGSEWVYAGSDTKASDFRTVTRFRIDAPQQREVVWNKSLVSMEGFEVSADGRLAGGLWPWPAAGVANLANQTFTKLGEGCWSSMTHARGPLFWYFDGAHRNVTMVDVDAAARWVVNINNAPGFDGAEVSHPRWTNHPRFLAITGPYNQGGPNQVRTGGRQVEVYLGRFSDDFSKVESWARVTTELGGESDPDVWMDLSKSPYPRQPRGRIGPPASLKPPAGAGAATAGRLVLNVRLDRAGTIPPPASILPYRHALVVNEYEVMDVIEGAYDANAIRIAQWAIRDGRILPESRRLEATAYTLTIERFDAHPELEGERLLSSSETSTLALYYDVTGR